MQGLSNEAVLETVASYTSAGDLSPREEQAFAAARQPSPRPEKSSEVAVATTPSADPELWTAIMASLDEQGKAQHRRHLSRHLSDVSPEVAGQLRSQRSEAARVSPEGVTYFDLSSSSGSSGSLDGGASYRDGGGAAMASPLLAAAPGDCGLILPSFEGYPAAVREAVLGQLCNAYLQGEAEAEGIVSAVPGCTPLLVLSTLGDGNCLSHAGSLGQFGVHDRDGRLRAAIHATMAHPAAGARIRERFERQLGAAGIPQEDWEAEWRRELGTFASSASYLSDVHAYALANVLRRPLVIFGDEQAAAAGLAGVYLPSLWPSPRSQCSRQPLALLFGWSHFSLLAMVQGEGPARPPLLPLCTRSGPLTLRFLSSTEAAEAAVGSDAGVGNTARQLVLLRRYMDAERMFNGRLGVRLSEAPQPNVLVSLLGSLYVRQAAQQQAEQQQAEQQQAEQQQAAGQQRQQPPAGEPPCQTFQRQ